MIGAADISAKMNMPLPVFFAALHLVQKNDAFAREYVRLQQRGNNPLTKMQRSVS
jgi:hypothetical protein